MAENQQGSPEREATTRPGKNYICGGCAGMANIMIAFLIKKVTFRQQLFGHLVAAGGRHADPLPWPDASAAVEDNFNGYNVRVFERHVSAAATTRRQPGAADQQHGVYSRGHYGGNYDPHERIQVLLQDHRHHGCFNNTSQAFRALVLDYGVHELYCGMGPILLCNRPYNMLFFGLCGPIKNSLPEAEIHAGHLVSNFVCSGFLGATLGSLFNPLNILKARKQSQVGGAFQSSHEVLRTIWSERGGKLSHLYRGAHLNYICGGCAGMVNIMITFPVQKILFRQQLFGVSTTEAIRQLQRDGMRTLYRGLLPPLLQKTTSMAIMFGYSNDISRLLSRPGSSPGLLTSSVAAMLAGTAEASLAPFERVQTLLQDQRHHVRFQNTFHAFRTLVREHGVSELYRGTVPILLRNGPSNGLFLGLQGPIRSSLPQAETHAGQLVSDFVSGGVLGATLGFLYYPLNVLKARKQSQVGGSFQASHEVQRTIWSERGGKLSHLYRGAHLNYYRSLLSWGITNAAYEFLSKVT